MKSRLSNIELLRFIAMLMVLLLHANYASIGVVSIVDVHTNTLTSIVRMLFEFVCIGAVNVFVLISGWFGIKASVKGAFSLIFQVIFFSVLIVGCFALFNRDITYISIRNLFPLYYMYWFIAAYLILYALSPVLNIFAANATKIQMMVVVVCFFVLEIFYGFLTDMGKFIGGYSAISFIGLYLLARLIRLHSIKLVNISFIRNLLLYALFTIIPVVIVFMGDNWSVRVFSSTAYNSPFVVLASIFLFLAFTKLNFNSHVINWLAASSFAIYVIHSHPLIFPYYQKIVLAIYSDVSVFTYIIGIICLSIIVGLICVIVDQFRIATWKWLCTLFLDKFLYLAEKSFIKLVEKL